MKKAIQLCAVLMLLASQASVWAQGIVVMGSGSADFKADRMVLKGTLSKESEDAGDALASLQALQARLKKAFAESDVEGLEIKQGGVSLGTGGDQNQQMAMVMMAGGNQPDMTPKVRAACEYFFSFPLTGLTELVESVGRIHSGARELDVKFSTGAVNEQMMVVMALSGQEPPTADPAIYFEVGQSAAVEKAAFGTAFQDAQARATAQAMVAGVTLGKVTAIETIEGGDAKRQGSHEGEHEVRIKVTFATQ